VRVRRREVRNNGMIMSLVRCTREPLTPRMVRASRMLNSCSMMIGMKRSAART